VLKSPYEPIDKIVAPLVINIGSPSRMVGFVPGQHLERADDDGMRHRDHGPFLSTVCGQPMIKADT
jgi:hypothetical protein